jgi:hypothetical protein
MTKRPGPICVVCSATIDAEKVRHALASGEVAKYCSYRCRDGAKQKRHWERKLRRSQGLHDRQVEAHDLKVD